MKKIIIVLVCLFLLSAIIAALTLRQKPQATALENKAEMTFYTLDGEGMNYTEAVSPSKTVLFLWTSTCDVCRDTLIYLSKECSLYDDINVLYLNIGESKRLVKSFLSYYKIADCITDKTLLDAGASIRQKFFILGVPTVIFFKDGTPVNFSYTLNEYLIEKVFGDG